MILKNSFDNLISQNILRENKYSFEENNNYDRIFIRGNANSKINFDNSNSSPTSPNVDDSLFNEHHAVNFSALKKKLKTISIYTSLYITILLFFIFIIKYHNSNDINMIQLNFESLLFVLLYLFLLSIAVPLLFRKKKIKLRVKNYNLEIRCFPTFSQSIPIHAIDRCFINVAKNNGIYNFINLKLFDNKRTKKIKLESGLSIILKNGKKILITSSNSFQKNNLLVKPY